MVQFGQASGKKLNKVGARKMPVPTCVQALDDEDDGELVMQSKATAKGKGGGKTPVRDGDMPGFTRRK
jgi:hypothetical protein